jgi:hypothetical protein
MASGETGAAEDESFDEADEVNGGGISASADAGAGAADAEPRNRAEHETNREATTRVEPATHFDSADRTTEGPETPPDSDEQ